MSRLSSYDPCFWIILRSIRSFRKLHRETRQEHCAQPPPIPHAPLAPKPPAKLRQRLVATTMEFVAPRLQTKTEKGLQRSWWAWGVGVGIGRVGKGVGVKLGFS